jgi:hypothetical protein
MLAGSIVVIVMDDATPMAAQAVPRAKAAARQVIDALGPNDLACVVYALDKRSGQEFTGHRARLAEAVDRFNGAIDEAGTDLQGQWWLSMPFDMFNLDGAALYLRTLRLIQSVAEDLAPLAERRKASVLVSVGIPTGTPGPDVSTAGSGNGRVRTGDPTGLHPDRPNQDFLKTASENTGGFAITDTNDPAPQIQQFLRENASYYLLGYAPLNTRALGRYRRIEVKVNRSGLMVQARKGYMEPVPATAKKATVVASALGAIAGLLPKTDLPMAVVRGVSTPTSTFPISVANRWP